VSRTETTNRLSVRLQTNNVYVQDDAKVTGHLIFHLLPSGFCTTLYIYIYIYIYKRNLTNIPTVLRRAVFRGLNVWGTDFQTIKQTYLRTVNFIEYQIYRGKLEGPQDISEPTPHWLDKVVLRANGNCLLTVSSFGFCDNQHDSFVTMYFHEFPVQKFGAAHFHVFRHLNQSLYGHYIIQILGSLCGSKWRSELCITYGARAMLRTKFRQQMG